MKKTIYIEGEVFTYDEETLEYTTTFPMSHDEGVELLRHTKRLLDEKHLEFILGYGTLLGAVRNHDIIPGDEDLDIIIRDEAHLLKLIPFLHSNGLRLIRAVKGSIYSFRMGENSYIDIYICSPIPKTSPWSIYCCCIAGKEYCPKKLLAETTEIEFLGMSFKCPKNPENLLAFWYGKTWRTPISGHDFLYEVKSHWYWVNKIKPFIQTAIAWPYWRHLVLHRFNNQSESLKEWRKER